MNEFAIKSFEDYLTTLRDNFGSAEKSGKRVRRYFRGQSKRALEGYDLKPSIGRYAYLNSLQPAERDRLENEVLETFGNHLLTLVNQPMQPLEEKDVLEIVINHAAHDDIRRRLDQYGVFDKQLFPDLDGIAKWLKYRVFEINGMT